MISGVVTRSQAAELAMVPSYTIRNWQHRGFLPVADRDGRGRPLYWPSDVLRVERDLRLRRAQL